jgi:hypothetical protein
LETGETIHPERGSFNRRGEGNMIERGRALKIERKSILVTGVPDFWALIFASG